MSSLPVPTKPDNAPPSDLKADVKEVVERVLSRLDDYTDLDDLAELHKQARGLAEYLRKHEDHGRTMRVAQLRIEKRIGEVLVQTVRPGNLPARQLIPRHALWQPANGRVLRQLGRLARSPVAFGNTKGAVGETTGCK